MTSLIDFVLKSGSPKMTCARDIFERQHEEYDPKTDYYKRFREGVQEMHKHERPKRDLLKIIGDLPENKHENYRKMADGYLKFLGRKSPTYFKPKRAVWNVGAITVPINPELGLEWDNQKFLIKLYLKAEKPSKDRLASILALMKKAIGSNGFAYAVLDVRNAKLYEYEPEMDRLLPLIEAEAQALGLILNQIK